MKHFLLFATALLYLFSSTASAEDYVIKMKTRHAIGEYLGFSIQSNGNEVEVTGADYDSSDGTFKVTSQEVELRGPITRLDCSSNMLESLDVSGDPLLEELYCDNNKYLTDLKLGKQPKLLDLYVGDNQLSSLDLSGAPELTSLSMYQNQFVTLDLSANTKLVDLICRENKLEGTLDLSANKCLQTLACYNNQLTAIKLAADNQIGKMELERNNINGKNMTDLVNSLPQYKVLEDYDDWFGMDPQGFYPFECNKETERNVLSLSDLQVLKSKGWPVYSVDDVDNFEDLNEVDESALTLVDKVSLSSHLSLACTDNGIRFSGADNNVVANLYDVQGRLIASTKAVNGEGVLATSQKGVLIVKIGDKKVKVVLK